jgi:hypothetical protein
MLKSRVLFERHKMHEMPDLCTCMHVCDAYVPMNVCIHTYIHTYILHTSMYTYIHTKKCLLASLDVYKNRRMRIIPADEGLQAAHRTSANARLGKTKSRGGNGETKMGEGTCLQARVLHECVIVTTCHAC